MYDKQKQNKQISYYVRALFVALSVYSMNCACNSLERNANFNPFDIVRP